MKKIFVFFIIIVFIFLSDVYGKTFNNIPQYKSYEWGIERNIVFDKIKNQNFKILENKIKKNDVDIIGYEDIFKNKLIHIYLWFTPISNKLFDIHIYGLSNTYKSFLIKLINKYGYPNDQDKDNDLLFWKDDGVIVLGTDINRGMVTYRSKKYWKLYNKELKYITSDDN